MKPTYFLIGIALGLNACLFTSITTEIGVPTLSNTLVPSTPIGKVLTHKSVSATNEDITSIVTPLSEELTMPLEEKKEMITPPADKLSISIVYDNRLYDQRLKAAWGFSALIEYHNHILLFDTGGDGSILLDNMKKMEIDPNSIESLVLSHIHGDHTGGVSALLEAGVRPIVYLFPSFPSSFKHQIQQLTTIVDVGAGQMIFADIFSTGEMGTSIPEQALAIRTSKGLVVITGCAHPGIVQIITRSKELFGDPIYLVLGGFHLGSKSNAEIAAILADFRRLGVKRAAPCHCTGDQAITMFAEEYGDDFIQIGTGSRIYIE